MSLVKKIKVKKISGNKINYSDDLIAMEEPLEISLGYFKEKEFTEKIISVTMRTPGNDAELSTGFLFTEGIIKSFSDVSAIVQASENKIQIILNENIPVEINSLDRNFYTTSSCGVCGKSSIEAIIVTGNKKTGDNHFIIDSEILYSLPDKLKRNQKVFEQTGGLHASALFSIEGNLIEVKEDVGRHNALDKLIGSRMKAASGLNDTILMLSGRASFELVQKAFMGGISFIAAVGAPSSLAVGLAIEKNITLVGFLRDNRFNIYSHEQRINISNPEKIICSLEE